jgi:hypothetical protein
MAFLATAKGSCRETCCCSCSGGPVAGRTRRRSADTCVHPAVCACGCCAPSYVRVLPALPLAEAACGMVGRRRDMNTTVATVYGTTVQL